MTPHEAHHISHHATPVCSAPCLTYVGAAGKTSQRDSSQLRHIAGIAEFALVHIVEFARAGSATLLASALRSTFGSFGARPEPFETSASSSSSSSSQPTFLGDVPCTEPYRKARPKPAKSPDTLVGRPTDLSETTFSPTSQSLSSGEKTPLRISRRRAAAACAKPSAFSAVTASGRAMRSPPSCRKFSSVRECGT